ncbi:hypothetical protein ACF1AB_35350 [Streptomyces sp. NPDC014846]|uniref:hypothetical protein n=1 Tax=Streptomyces sp. NPDC014846 TaxID=3364922 RepID=UPI0036FB21C5
MPYDELNSSHFARWLIQQSHLAGYDTRAPGTQMSILLLTAMALSDGLDTATTNRIADALSVSPAEVTAAYIPEMRRSVLAELLHHPDLLAIDAHLDGLARRHR